MLGFCDRCSQEILEGCAIKPLDYENCRCTQGLHHFNKIEIVAKDFSIPNDPNVCWGRCVGSPSMPCLSDVGFNMACAIILGDRNLDIIPMYYHDRFMLFNACSAFYGMQALKS